jgi:hypothetical protein
VIVCVTEAGVVWFCVAGDGDDDGVGDGDEWLQFNTLWSPSGSPLPCMHKWKQADLAPHNVLQTMGEHMWGAGPSVMKLKQMMDANNVIRYSLTPNSPQMGPGAAVHLSDISEPGAIWLKGAGTIENLVRYLGAWVCGAV